MQSQSSMENSDLQEVKIDTSSLLTPSSWKSPYNKECPCCLEIPQQGRVILDCRHLLCVTCFVRHVRNSNECPVCRKQFHSLEPPRRSTRIARYGDNIITNEINRRLQIHINDVNNIRRNLNRTNQLRNAPPLRAQRAATTLYNDSDNIDIVEENIRPLTSRQYIIITVFTVIDILIMLIWMQSINSKHKSNN